MSAAATVARTWSTSENGAAFLGDLEVVRQHYTGDRFARALTLPIPVLV
jgi:hypothetical protein